MRVYDRSRVLADWKCERSRYLQYDLGGKGVVPATTPLALYLGTSIHDGLAALAGGVDIEEIATTARKQVLAALLDATSGEVEDVSFAWEQATLVEGLLRGFARSAWPRLKAAYPKILWVEEEMEYEHEGLVFMSRPDLVMADEEGNAWYVEFKSTSSKKPEWINSWGTAVQLHSTIRAIEASKGVKVQGVIVQGLYKGYVAYGKQSSPMCYAYTRGGNPPFTQSEVRYEYAPGFKRTPVWDLEGGVKAWVEGMPEAVLDAQFPQSPPIFVKDALIDAFFAQRGVREHEIKLALSMLEDVDDEDLRASIMHTAFPQKFDQCYPAWGSICPYTRICFGRVSNPLEEGFTYRTPHHKREMDDQAASHDEERPTPITLYASAAELVSKASEGGAADV